MTMIQQVATALDASRVDGLTVSQLMGRTHLGEWSVRNALRTLRVEGIVTHGSLIVTGEMGRPCVRYRLTKAAI